MDVPKWYSDSYCTVTTPDPLGRSESGNSIGKHFEKEKDFNTVGGGGTALARPPAHPGSVKRTARKANGGSNDKSSLISPSLKKKHEELEKER